MRNILLLLIIVNSNIQAQKKEYNSYEWNKWGSSSKTIPEKKRNKIYQLRVGYVDSIFPNEEIANCINLESIILSRCYSPLNSYRFTEDVNLKRLKKLSIDTARLKKLKKLKSVEITSVSFDKFPEELSTLDSLKSLTFLWTDIDSIPNSISKFKRIEVLDLSGNFISYVSDSLMSLKNIKTLGLANNNLSTIPEILTKMTNLEELRIDNHVFPELYLGLNSIYYNKEEELNKIIKIMESNKKLKQLVIDIDDCSTKNVVQNKTMNNNKLIIWGNSLHCK